MRLINKTSGYDADLRSTYQSVTVEMGSHIYDISKDNHGIHIMVDGKPCYHFTDETKVIVTTYIK